jgi:O-antigen ligase
VWLWGKTVRYVIEHPMVLLTGIGNDRKRFLEQVIGFSYDGDHVHFQTAHNLFLDVLVKGGLGTLALLVASCVWFLRLAVKAVKTNVVAEQSQALIGIGVVLLAFWPPFMLVNLVGEEMFTDNLQLHWTMLFGLLLGLMTNSIGSATSQVEDMTNA